MFQILLCFVDISHRYVADEESKLKTSAEVLAIRCR